MEIMRDKSFVNNTEEEKIKIERDLYEDFNIEKILGDPNTPEDVKLALSFEKFKPVEQIVIGEYEFFLAPIVKGYERDGALGYVFDEKKLHN